MKKSFILAFLLGAFPEAWADPGSPSSSGDASPYAEATSSQALNPAVSDNAPPSQEAPVADLEVAGPAVTFPSNGEARSSEGPEDLRGAAGEEQTSARENALAAAIQAAPQAPKVIPQKNRFPRYKSSAQRRVHEGKEMDRTPSGMRLPEMIDYSRLEGVASENKVVRQARRHGNRCGIDGQLVSVTNVTKKLMKALRLGAKVKELDFKVTTQKARQTFKALHKISSKKLILTAQEANEEVIQRLVEEAFKNPHSQMESLELRIWQIAASGRRPQDALPIFKRRASKMEALRKFSIEGPFNKETLVFVDKYAPHLTHLKLAAPNMTAQGVDLEGGLFKNVTSLTLGSKHDPLWKHFWLERFLDSIRSYIRRAEATGAPTWLPSLKNLSLYGEFEPRLLESIADSPLARQLKFLRLEACSQTGNIKSGLHSSATPYDFPELEELQIAEMNLGKLTGGLKQFFSPNGLNAPKLKALHLSRCVGVGSADILHIFQNIPSLVELKIEGGFIETPFSEEDKTLAKLSDDRRVSLSLLSNHLKGDQLAEILLTNGLCDHLESLNVRLNDALNMKELEKIMDQKFSSLKNLELGAGFSREGLEEIAKRKGNFPQLNSFKAQLKSDIPPYERKEAWSKMKEAFEGAYIGI